MFDLNKIKLNIDKNLILIVLAISSIVVTGALIFTNNSNSSPKVIAQNSVDYLNKNILQKGQTATLVSFSEESGVIKINMNVGGNNYNSYVTKDGKIFFPEGLSLDLKPTEPAVQNQDNSNNSAAKTSQTCDSLAKVDKPLLEAYVVSKCPFGLQMQRAMAEAVKNIPALAEFVKVRYIGEIYNGAVTAMHGDAEAEENLRQICIREEQPEKYWDYISCHIKAGDVNGCLDTAGIDQNKLSTCVKDSSRGIAYAKEDFSLNSKYNITGSPTLVLNSQPVSEYDFGGRSSEAIKNIVSCSSKGGQAFSSTKLDTNEAATSFSLIYASESSGKQKGSANNNPSCEPI